MVCRCKPIWRWVPFLGVLKRLKCWLPCREFIGRVVVRTNLALQNIKARQAAAIAEGRGAALAVKIRSIVQPAPPPPPSGEDGGAEAAAPAEVSEAPVVSDPSIPPELQAARAALSTAQVRVLTVLLDLILT